MMKSIYNIVTGTLLSFILLSVMITEDANAIPSFARKYGTSCGTCHVLAPKLNAFGRGFKNFGYIWPGGDKGYVKERPVPLGAPPQKRIWPKVTWPGEMPGSSPISFRIRNEFIYQPEGEISTDFVFPSLINLHVGGSLTESFTFLGTFHLYERGEQRLHQFSVVVRDALGVRLPENLLNLKIGRFEPSAIPFSSVRQLSPFGLLLNSYDLQNPMAVTGGAHAHGESGFTFGASQSGVELFGSVGDRLLYAVGAVNGNGDAASDDNSSKDFFGRIAYKLGGRSVTGRAPADYSETRPWVDNSIRLGVFGYRGTLSAIEEEVGHEMDNTPEHGEMGNENEHPGEIQMSRWGGDLDIWLGNLNIAAAVMRGVDEDHSEKEDFTATFLQGDYVIYPWLVAGLGHEMVLQEEMMDIERIVLSLSSSFRPNVIGTVGHQFFLNNSGEDRLVIAIDIAF